MKFLVVVTPPSIYHSIKLPFSTARRLDLTVGSAQWGTQIEVFRPLEVPLYTILMSSTFGPEN